MKLLSDENFPLKSVFYLISRIVFQSFHLIKFHLE